MKQFLFSFMMVIPLPFMKAQHVGIGTASPIARLHVDAVSNHSAVFNGANNMYISLNENNIYRGYIGSFSGAEPDVDFGTGVGNTTGKLHLTIQALPRLTIDDQGRIGIGTTTPQDRLHVVGGTIRIPFLAGSGNRLVRVNELGQLQAGELLGAMVVPFNAFVKEDETSSSSVVRSPLGVYVTSGASDILYAPVYVQLGARLTSIDMVCIDNAAANLELALVRYQYATNVSTVVATLTTSGASTSAQTISLNFSPEHVVDYTQFGYYLRLRTVGGNWAGSNTRLRSVRFNFLQPNF